jgi:hypothetical protein
MKHLILGSMFPFLTSVATAQTKADWQTLLTKLGSKVTAVAFFTNSTSATIGTNGDAISGKSPKNVKCHYGRTK